MVVDLLFATLRFLRNACTAETKTAETTETEVEDSDDSTEEEVEDGDETADPEVEDSSDAPSFVRMGDDATE
ncbi:hypothetical protein AAVH_29442 [Aphelenchoides avenae]|nr:hypothetical protein AAVH_29442 [Aphelenchus avenae]